MGKVREWRLINTKAYQGSAQRGLAIGWTDFCVRSAHAIPPAAGNSQTLQSALDLQKRALQLKLDARGREHAETAASYNNLGAVLRLAGRLQDALEHYEHALSIRRRVLAKC